MIAWWRSLGWAILASGVGIGVLGLTTEDGWLEEADRSVRSVVVRASLAQEFGIGWEWQEHQAEPKRWLWQGFARVEQEQLPLWVIEFDEQQRSEFANEMTGPISLSVLLDKRDGNDGRDGRGEQGGLEAEALLKLEAMNKGAMRVIRYWPLSWLRSQSVSLDSLREALAQDSTVVASFGLDWVNDPQTMQQQALVLLEPLPLDSSSEDLPQEMDLLEVNAASIGWPQQQSLAPVLWAGVPTALLANYEQEGAVVRVPLILRKGESLVASLPLLVALDYFAVSASELRLQQMESGKFLLQCGEQLRLEIDEQGRLAVPASALEEQELLPRIAMKDFLPILHQVEVPSLDQSADLAQEQQLQSLIEGAQVLWFDEQGHQAGLSEAQALAQMLNPALQVQERLLRVNRPLGAVVLLVLAFVLARAKRRTHFQEFLLGLGVLLALALASYLSVRLGEWWVSPLPGGVVLLLILFFRERQRWVEAAREALLAEQELEQTLVKSKSKQPSKSEEAARRGE